MTTSALFQNMVGLGRRCRASDLHEVGSWSWQVGGWRLPSRGPPEGGLLGWISGTWKEASRGCFPQDHSPMLKSKSDGEGKQYNRSNCLSCPICDQSYLSFYTWGLDLYGAVEDLGRVVEWFMPLLMGYVVCHVCRWRMSWSCYPSSG